MSTRIKPYHTKQTSWREIVSNLNMIPMNQRHYDWDAEPHIMKFINDLFHMFEKTNYYEKMGSIIYYTGNVEGKEVWDGQQRLITVILILKAISVVSNKLNFKNDSERETARGFANSIIHLLKEDIDCMVDITDRIKKFQDNPAFATFDIIPKIHCINPHDNTAICEIFNTYNPLINYLHNDQDDIDDTNEDSGCGDDEDEDEDEDEDDIIDDNDEDCHSNSIVRPHRCMCGAKIKVKSIHDTELLFANHLTKSQTHSYDDSKIKSKDTNIYKAYEYICKRIHSNFKSLKKLKEFYQFILNNIDLNVYECNDLWYVSRIFDWENNRGKHVHALDVIKNTLLANVDESKRCEIYDNWNKIKETKNDIYSDFGQKILNCAIQIYNKKIQGKVDQEQLFTTLLKSNTEDTYTEIKSLFKIVKTLFHIIDEIKKDRYGRLMLHVKRCSISWEGYMYFLLPIFYFNNNTINADTIELIVRWCFRNINTKNRVMNNLCYAHDFIELSNSYIHNANTNYNDRCLKILQKHKDVSVNDDNYVTHNVNKEWKQTRTLAKMLLYYLETSITNDDYKPNLTHDLEHIYPENKKNDMSTPNIIYKLGNLTILEAKNSKNGHKGNRSIKDNSFDSKKIQYKDSSHKITRNLSTYTIFDSNTINERTIDLFNQLNVCTNY